MSTDMTTGEISCQMTGEVTAMTGAVNGRMRSRATAMPGAVSDRTIGAAASTMTGEIGGTMIGQNGQAIEVIAIWMAVYLSINLFISVLMNIANKKFKLVER